MKSLYHTEDDLVVDVSLVIPRGMPDSSGIDGTKLVSGCKIPHKPETYRVKYPSIPEEFGSPRGMTSEGDIYRPEAVK